MTHLHERLRYRLLTGPDDADFCARVSRLLDEGYELYGSPAITYDGERAIVAQALTLPPYEAVRFRAPSSAAPPLPGEQAEPPPPQARPAGEPPQARPVGEPPQTRPGGEPPESPDLPERGTPEPPPGPPGTQ